MTLAPSSWALSRKTTTRFSQLAMAAILTLGFALRLHRLGAPSLWLDEMGQASMAAGGLVQAVQGARIHHGAAPLDYVLTWLALQIAHADFVVRLPAAFLGALTLALVYHLGRTLFDRWTGVLAALLLAVAPLHLRYSQEARFYALFTAVAVASTLALSIALRRNTRASWAVYTLAVAAALYSHYYAALLVLIQAVVVMAYPRLAAGPVRFAHGRRNFLLSCLVAAAAFLPWLFYAVLRETGTPRAVLPELTWDLPRAIVTGLVAGEALAEPPVGLLWLYLGLAMVGAAAGLAQRRTRAGTLLLLLPLIIAPLLIVLALRQVRYFFALRQILFLLPFFLILVSAGVTALARGICFALDRTKPLPGTEPSPAHSEDHGRDERPQAARGWTYLLSAAAALVLVWLLIWPLRPAIAAVFTTPRQDWRDALAFVAANAGPDDALVAPGVPNHYFRYYSPQWLNAAQNITSAEGFRSLGQIAPAAWVVLIPETAASTQAVRPFLRDAAALELDFGPNMAVYYWRPGAAHEEMLAQSLHWTLPRNAQALSQLARLYEQAGGDESAAADNAARQAVALADSPAAASEIETWRGSMWQRQGQPEQAIAAYRQALALWPDNVEALVRLGERLLTRGAVDEAAIHLERAAELDPASFWALRFLGDVRARQGRLAEAASLLRAAVAVQPDDAETWYRLGDALAATGDRAGAAAAFERYRALAPDGPRVDEINRRLKELR